MRKKPLLLVVAIVLCVAVLAACSTTGPVASTAPSAAQSSAAAQTSAAASAAPSASAAAPASAAASQASAAPATSINGKPLVIGYNSYSDSVPFSKSISDDMKKIADQRGIKLLRNDTNGDSTTALKNLDTFLTQGANVIVDSTWVDAATQAMAAKCLAAKVPYISIDIPVNQQYQSNSYFMGIDNYGAGTVTGESAAKFIKEKWNGQLDNICISYTESTGEVLKKRIQGAIDAVRKAGITIDDKNIVWVNPQSTDATVETKSLTTDFLTAHPNAHHILMLNVNDEAADGQNAAVQTSNRTPDVIIVSQGCDNVAINNLRKTEDNSWVGATGYFPETYGNYIFQIIDTLAAGGTPPQETFVHNIFITKANLNQYYPQ